MGARRKIDIYTDTLSDDDLAEEDRISRDRIERYREAGAVGEEAIEAENIWRAELGLPEVTDG